MRNIIEITRRQPPLLIPARLKVCAYVRVSTDHREQMNSLENQTQYYERLISSNPDYEYCGIFSDAGISGAKENRPGFIAMMEKKAVMNLIITKSISRFARNTTAQICELGHRIRVIFEEEMVNTLKSEGEPPWSWPRSPKKSGSQCAAICGGRWRISSAARS